MVIHAWMSGKALAYMVLGKDVDWLSAPFHIRETAGKITRRNYLNNLSLLPSRWIQDVGTLSHRFFIISYRHTPCMLERVVMFEQGYGDEAPFLLPKSLVSPVVVRTCTF
ncbi:uncharacterized protein ARMOST_15549 [Armillaria ostoyae]|uniref:Uncharacterized protein n=1 Tax=Armillaria ostoyae TaxID=47428 RepID=A0A284RTM8_ARMOS|nr:uncharacterized protein ARMOST_15549 [Armillaria ostoyae]